MSSPFYYQPPGPVYIPAAWYAGPLEDGYPQTFGGAPEGFVWIITCVDAVYGEGDSGIIFGVGPTADDWFYSAVTGADYDVFQWRGWHVMGPTASISSSGGDCPYAMVSGFSAWGGLYQGSP